MPETDATGPDLTSPDLTSLVAARMSHDLVGPLGAIANGVELLGLTGGGPGSETALIAESVAEANARIKFMRIAFGPTDMEGHATASEIREILAGLSVQSRITRRWRPEASVPRPQAKAVFLAMMCLEPALPRGGLIAAEPAGEAWEVAASGPTLGGEEAPWDLLSGSAPPGDLPAARVEFALLPRLMSRLDRAIAYDRGHEHVTLRL